jgi:hypothetical protein
MCLSAEIGISDIFFLPYLRSFDAAAHSESTFIICKSESMLSDECASGSRYKMTNFFNVIDTCNQIVITDI